jgi:hypothetical protein
MFSAYYLCVAIDFLIYYFCVQPFISTLVLLLLLLLFCSIRVWTQGLPLSRQVLYHLSHSVSHFLCMLGISEKGLANYLPRASFEPWVPRITGVSHRHLALGLFLMFFFQMILTWVSISLRLTWIIRMHLRKLHITACVSQLPITIISIMRWSTYKEKGLVLAYSFGGFSPW